jgi:hypothetical protein
MKKLFLCLSLIFGIVLVLNLVSATVQVTYSGYYAQIESDGSITYTNDPVEDFDTVGYVCLDLDCLEVGERVEGLTKSTNSNSITLEFPTYLKDENGYGIWFYKSGYIHWEQNPTWNGEGIVDEEYRVYFLRKAKAWSPVMDLHVVDETVPSFPIEIGAEIKIDADTYSALQNAGVLDYNPSEINDEVETEVVLRIYNGEDIIYQDSQELSISYSESEEVLFSYEGFESTGEYTIQIFTNVLDDKIIESITQYAEEEIIVIPVGLNDYSYSYVTGLSITPEFLEVGDSATILFETGSYYVDEFDNQSPIGTDTVIIISREGVELERVLRHFDLPFYSSNLYTFEEAGEYSVRVESQPSECQGSNGCLESAQEITFIVSNPFEPNELDLYIDSGYVYDAPLYDNEFPDLRFITHNTGSQALDVSVKIYIDGERVLEAIETLPFVVGENDWGIGFSDYLEAGEHVLRIVVDSNNEFEETNETNNEFVFEFEVLEFEGNEAPIITVYSPIDGNEYDDNDVLFKIKVNEESTVWYSLNNGVNVEVYSENGLNFETLLDNLGDGDYELEIYAQDLEGAISTEIVYFSVDTSNDDDHDDREDNNDDPLLPEDPRDADSGIIRGDTDDEPLLIDLSLDKSKVGISSLVCLFWFLLLLLIILLIIIYLVLRD